MKIIQDLLGAFRLISVIPVPGPFREAGASSLAGFPVVGAVLGLGAVLIAWGLHLLPAFQMQGTAYQLLLSLVGGVLVTALEAALTRGFHLDGLTDMFDGFGGGWEKNRILEIMRDSRVGSFGVIALIIHLALKSLANALLIFSGRYALLWAAPIVARLMMVCTAAFNVYARENAAYAGNLINAAQGLHFWQALAVTIVILWLWVPVALWPVLGLACVAALSAQVSVVALSRAKIAGVTGDILGAVCELSQLAFLLAAVLV